MATRTFGWVQDPGKIENLRKTVEVFDDQSATYHELVQLRIPTLVSERDGRERLLAELRRVPLKLKYADLVGTAFTPRSQSRCNGILQAAIDGQGRPFLLDWPANNFLRWAHAVGFICYDAHTDCFSITDFGLQYTQTPTGSEAEQEILSQAFLSYPPVMRVLNLLADGEHLTKFDIGRQLGFVGEDGFTSLPQNILVRSLSQTEDAKERNKMLTDWDGTSDKYARMIANWLKHLGWLEQVPKRVQATFGEQTYEYPIPQAYVITPAGLQARRRGLGTNIHSRIPKNVFWEMLATKGKDRDYIRTRRALILMGIETESLSLAALKQHLAAQGFNESEATIADDLQGLAQIGLNVQHAKGKFFLRDTIQQLFIPSFATQETVKSDIQEMVDGCRARLKHVPHDYLVLIPMSFSQKDSRLFEMKTIELLIEQCGFNGLHLGGADQPDGLIFTQQLASDYGVIVDTKAYKTRFTLPASERDKMTRYVNENLQRDERHEPKWWKHFPQALHLFQFWFVSGRFGGDYEKQLRRISTYTQNTPGAAITSLNLLLLAEQVATQEIDLQTVGEKFGCLGEVEI